MPKKAGISNLFNFCTLESNGFSFRKLQKLFFFISPHSAALSPRYSLHCSDTHFCRINVNSRAARVRCQSQRATAHCKFYGRDLLGPKQERRLKDTRYFSPHAFSASPPSLQPSVCFLFCFVLCVLLRVFPETVALRTSNSLTSHFSKKGPLKLMIMLCAGTTPWWPNGEPLLGPDGERSQKQEGGVKLVARNSGPV